jgi:hypothetical protein
MSEKTAPAETKAEKKSKAPLVSGGLVGLVIFIALTGWLAINAILPSPSSRPNPAPTPTITRPANAPATALPSPARTPTR